MDEEIGNEVSRKIKAAIKAKLVELGAYVDDELPDYIMIMVANKRSRSQMDSDLALFLNNNTKIFTNWLHTVLDKLKQVTVASIDKKSESKKSKKRASSVESKSSSSSGKKSKKKKRRKDKKQKKKHKKQKSKDSSEDEVPKKKLKKEKPDFIAKQVGKAIIGSLKEKHKTSEPLVENSTEKTANDPLIDEALKKDDVEPEEPAVEVAKEPEPVEIQESSEDLTIVSMQLANSESHPTTVMAPTRELLKEHDKLTEVKPGEKQATSEDSLPAEELRRQLLLSRAQQKLRERNIATRMRSNSPEVVVVDDSMMAQPSELTVEKPKSASDSSKLSLRPSSFGSPSVTSDRGQSPEPEQVSKKQISSLIVKPAELNQPEIPSFVQVKPREFMSAEKQANKNLILKAVAAAERSVARIPKPKEPVAPPRHIFTRELREKRYEKLSVTVDQTAGRHSEDKDETFISSKPKDKTESFIKGWLEDVEEAGRQDALLIPDDLDEPATEKLTNNSQLVVTVDASSDCEDEPNPKIRDAKVNRISDRFAKISKPFENHKLKKEYQDFLRSRGKKRTIDGESKNERLIAELSMKFGKVEETITRKRSNDNEQAMSVRERSSKILKR